MDFNFKTEPYAHQVVAFNRAKDRDYFALFADMGTGKTKVVIDIAAYRFCTSAFGEEKERTIDALMIIAPNHVHEQWVKDELPKHCPIEYNSFVWNSAQINRVIFKRMFHYFCDTHSDSKLKIFAVNIEAFQSNSVEEYIADFVHNNRCLIVIDEATRIKHDSAKRTKLIHKLVKYGYRMILTGTPTAKSPFDLWAQMEFLKSNYFGCNFFIFQHRYGVMASGINDQTGKKYLQIIDEGTYAKVVSQINKMIETRNGQLMPDDYDTIGTIMGVSEKNVRFIETHPEYTRFKRMDELKGLMKEDVFSIRKEECLDLPPKIYEKIFVTLSPEQKRIYRNLKTELLAQYEGLELTIQNKIVLTLRLMQVTGGFFPYMREKELIKGSDHYQILVSDAQLIGQSNVKLTALRDDLGEVNPDTKVIVWAAFVAELKHIYKELSKDYKCCLYYGGVNGKDREKIVADFKDGKYDIFIGNVSTAGFGLNLQIASLQYFFSNSFKVEDRLQGEDRSHRIGMLGPAVYKDIIVKGTVDEKVYANIKQGRDLNDFFKSSSLEDILSFDDTEESEDTNV